MKFVGLVSGGKDSIYTIIECIRNGHEIVACAHLAPRIDKSHTADTEGEEEESYMYQTAASECLQVLVEECIGVALISRSCRGKSFDTSLIYDHDKKGSHEVDEVEDMYALLAEVKSLYPDVEAVSSGAILSTYQRTRIESVCGRLGLTSLAYLWRVSTQRQLLECMLEDGLEAVLVKVASPPGLTIKHLNKTLGSLYYGGVFDRLNKMFDFHICGEGGEYETLVLDCTLYKRRLELTEVEVIETDDGVGVLRIKQCRSIEKEVQSDGQKDTVTLYERLHTRLSEEDDCNESDWNESKERLGTHIKATETPLGTLLPHVKVLPGGLAHVSQMLCQVPIEQSIPDAPREKDEIESELAVAEAINIFHLLRHTLYSIEWDCGSPSFESDDKCATAKDVVFVHLYLANMQVFQKINVHYKEFFGTIMPPSRSCVALGKSSLPGGRRVMMDCIVQRGSGSYMRWSEESYLERHMKPGDLVSNDINFIRLEATNPHHSLRKNLHVQSISHWAPVCVGPYSQANILRSGVIFVAGQIGLVPSTMKICHGGWEMELRQCWRNAAAVLDALAGSLNDVIAGLVYVSSSLEENTPNWNYVLRKLNAISRHALVKNGGILPGGEVSHSSSPDFDGYEDYETWKEMCGEDENHEEESKHPSDEIPLLVVAIEEMPVHATVEVEIISATSRAASCLQMDTSTRAASLPYPTTNEVEPWSFGYSTNSTKRESSDGRHYQNGNEYMDISTITRRVGTGCASIAYVTASLPNVSQESTICLGNVFDDMICSAIESMEDSSRMHHSKVLHVRLFYSSQLCHDMAHVQASLQASISSNFLSQRDSKGSYPAFTAVPVSQMFISPSSITNICQRPMFAMQIIALDLIHMETELWINYNRKVS